MYKEGGEGGREEEGVCIGQGRRSRGGGGWGAPAPPIFRLGGAEPPPPPIFDIKYYPLTQCHVYINMLLHAH